MHAAAAVARDSTHHSTTPLDAVGPESPHWPTWRGHFERNESRALPAVESTSEIPESWRAPLSRSLARFQLGEGGEGRIAREIYRTDIRGIDDDYRVALGLFVAEEGRHARILGTMVRALGGNLLRKQWTESLFVHGRRLAGTRLKLVVLLAAEVIGIGFYGLLADALPNGDVKRALRQIADDEQAHLRFHADFFRTQTTTPIGAIAFRAIWRSVAAAACAVVLVDHRDVMDAMDLSTNRAARRLLDLVLRVEREVLAAG